MDKKTIDTLRVMLCGEIEDIAKQGKLSHETLDVLKDLVETEKNLGKIEKLEKEKEEKLMESMNMSMGMDGGYSQRKYYIDADYQPNSYRGNSYMDGVSYGRGMGGNSYGYYNPMYDGMYARRGGYSRMAGKEEIIMELRDMMRETDDEKIKAAISEVVSKISK